MSRQRFMSAQEAAETLDITKATLYSYVSRGLIRSESGQGKSRARQYLAADVISLKERKAQRQNPARSAASALSFGSPVLESSITLIQDGSLYYRGHNAIELAAGYSFEDVAALLWTGAFPADSAPGIPLFSAEQQAILPPPSLVAALADMPALDLFQTVLLPISEQDLAAYNTEATAVAQTGVRLLRLLIWCITRRESLGPIADQLARVWVGQEPRAATLLNAALILCADHELNISSFSARCVASAGTSPYLAVNAALCALRGHRHGGQTHRVAAFLDAAAHAPPTAAADQLKREGYIPGFGHPLYPDGDPRGRYLVDLVRATAPEAPILPLADEILDLARRSLNVAPTVDFGLVVLARALALPANAPMLLFALGRIAGWIGHIGEEYQRGRLIRPRATYTGVMPDLGVIAGRANVD